MEQGNMLLWALVAANMLFSVWIFICVQKIARDKLRKPVPPENKVENFRYDLMASSLRKKIDDFNTSIQIIQHAKDIIRDFCTYDIDEFEYDEELRKLKTLKESIKEVVVEIKGSPDTKGAITEKEVHRSKDIIEKTFNLLQDGIQEITRQKKSFSLPQKTKNKMILYLEDLNRIQSLIKDKINSIIDIERLSGNGEEDV